MIYLLVILLELLVLFFTSKFIIKAIFAILLRIFRSQHAAMVMTFILFFPGVIIHELAHFLTAELLLVRAHDLEVAPSLSGGSLQMGSVKISQTDFIRRMIIGVAPVIWGSAVLVAALFYFVNNVSFGIGALVFWVTFFVTNTMFSSKKDLDGAFGFLSFVGFLVLLSAILAAILKIDLPMLLSSFFSAEIVSEKIKLVATLFLLPVGINMALFFLGKVILGRRGASLR